MWVRFTSTIHCWWHFVLNCHIDLSPMAPLAGPRDLHWAFRPSGLAPVPNGLNMVWTLKLDPLNRCLGVGNMQKMVETTVANMFQICMLDKSHYNHEHMLTHLGGIWVIPCCANQENFKYTPKHEFIHHVTGAHHFQSHTCSQAAMAMVSQQLFLCTFSCPHFHRACRNGNITETM